MKESEQVHIAHAPTLHENETTKFHEILLSGFRVVALTNCVE